MAVGAASPSCPSLLGYCDFASAETSASFTNSKEPTASLTVSACTKGEQEVSLDQQLELRITGLFSCKSSTQLPAFLGLGMGLLADSACTQLSGSCDLFCLLFVEESSAAFALLNVSLQLVLEAEGTCVA